MKMGKVAESPISKKPELGSVFLDSMDDFGDGFISICLNSLDILRKLCISIFRFFGYYLILLASFTNEASSLGRCLLVVLGCSIYTNIKLSNRL